MPMSQDMMQSEKRKISIGFDIGVASVGWVILDTTQESNYEIIDIGVRLFDDPSAEGGDSSTSCQERREFRTRRRNIRRKQLRKRDLMSLFIKYNLVEGDDVIKQKEYIKNLVSNGLKNADGQQIYPFVIKEKGLSQALSNDELIIILYSYMQHRGYFYELDEEDLKNTKKGNVDEQTKKEILQNYPCLIQKQNYEKYHKYIGLTENLYFSNEAFKKEILQIFNNQTNLPQAFKDAYLKLFSRVRDFSQGPGSKNSPTNYGVWKLDGTHLDNLWDSTVGKCSIYPEENRAFKNAPISELFKFLDEINGLQVNLPIITNTGYEYLDQQFKTYLLQDIINKLTKKNKITSCITPTYICKLVNEFYSLDDKHKIQLTDFQGFKYVGKKSQDSAKKAYSLEKLENLWTITTFLLKANYLKTEEVDFKNVDYLNKINNFFLTLTKSANDIKARRQEIKNFLVQANIAYDEALEQLSEQQIIKKIKSSTLSARASLSTKAMMEFITFTLQNLNNHVVSSKYFYEQLVKNVDVKLENKKYFPKDYFKDEILSKTAKRAFNQSINVLNKIIHLYSKKYQINNIIIELARAANSKEEKDLIAQTQKKNKEFKDRIEETLITNGIDPNQYDWKNPIVKEKILLWEIQDYKDLYDGSLINLLDLIDPKNERKYQVDHIIPISLSFNNALTNKVLSKSELNHEKGQRTPYQWLSSIGKFEQFKHTVMQVFGNKDEYKTKRDLLLYLGDPTSQQAESEFIERNLVDTRIATRLFLNKLQEFFNTNFNKNLHGKVNIITLNGALTTYARNKIFTDDKNKTLIPKIRENNVHHAIDAAIIAFMGLNYSIKRKIEWYKRNVIFNDHDPQNKVQQFNASNFLAKLKAEQFTRDYGIKLKALNENKDEQLQVKFSTLLKTNKNIRLFKDTVYGYKEVIENNKKVSYLYSKIDLLSLDNKKLDEWFTKKEKDLVIYSADPHNYKKLKDIYLEYKNRNAQEKSEKSKVNYFIQYINDKKEELRELNITEGYYDNVITLFNHDDNDLNNVTRIRKLMTKTKAGQTPAPMKRNNFKSVKTSIVSFETRIYQDKNNNFVPVRIDYSLLNTSKNNQLMINKDKLDQYLDKLNIKNKDLFLRISNGTCFTPTNELIELVKNKQFDEIQLDKNLKEEICKNIYKNKLFKFIGSYNIAHKFFEIKNVDAVLKQNKKEKLETKRLYVNTKQLNKWFFVCDVDTLGNIYNKRNLDDFFKNN